LKSQIADADNLIEEMNEVKGKEVKQCDAKNFEAVKKKLVAGGLEKEQLYLFDSLAKFFSGNADAVYE